MRMPALKNQDVSMKGTPSRWLWIAPLALACSSVHALGLGQIQVKSKPGQPLLAVIPVESVQPDDLASLQAQLADPDDELPPEA